MRAKGGVVKGNRLDILFVQTAGGRGHDLGIGRASPRTLLPQSKLLSEISGVLSGERGITRVARRLCGPAVRAVEDFGLAGISEDWKAERERIRTEILAEGWSEEKRSFVQQYGGTALDASLLLLPLTGFLPPDDPRVIGTVQAIQRELVEDGLVLRYRPESAPDGLAGTEGTFLVCSFWLADALTMMGRWDEASELFERLLSLRNDVGLLAEEYDPRARRQLGNFPQAFSHVGLVDTARAVSDCDESRVLIPGMPRVSGRSHDGVTFVGRPSRTDRSRC